jgi:hypothetical protein
MSGRGTSRRDVTPRWVKISGIGAALMAAVLAVLLVGGHGPRSHTADVTVTQQGEAGAIHK